MLYTTSQKLQNDGKLISEFTNATTDCALFAVLPAIELVIFYETCFVDFMVMMKADSFSGIFLL